MSAQWKTSKMIALSGNEQPSPCLVSIGWDADRMLGADTAILDHNIEVTGYRRNLGPQCHGDTTSTPA